MKNIFRLLILALVLTLFSMQARAGSFDKGTVTGTIAIGSGQFFNEDYLIFGVGVGYYLIDGVEAAIDVDTWTGGSPSIYEVTPKLTYVYDNPSKVKPYLGVFYSRMFIDGFDDSDTLGYRAGMYTPASDKAYIGIGVVYTELQDCTDSIFVDCSDTYTELSVIFTL